MRYKYTILFISLLLLPLSAMAQTDLGIDGGLYLRTFDNDNFDNVTTFEIPTPQIRASFMVSPVTAVQLNTGFNHRSTDGNSTTRFIFGGSVLYHFDNIESNGPIPFVIGGGGFDHLGRTGDDDTQFYLGGGLGFKMPLTDNLRGRLTGRFNRLFESDLSLPGNQIALTVGISYVFW